VLDAYEVLYEFEKHEYEQIAGWHPAAWREPATRPGELFTPKYGLLGLSRPANRYAPAGVA
jgi:hypothetical protein